MSSWRDSVPKPKGYPDTDWPQSVYLAKADRHITKLEAKHTALREAAKRAKVLLDDATYHDGRYGQHTDAAWQKEACEVAKLLEGDT